LEPESTLDTVLVELSYGRRKTLREIIVGWRQHVERLVAEQGKSLKQDRDVWGAHDFLAALFLRDVVERGLHQSPSEVLGEAQALVRHADHSFVDFTVDDIENVVARFSGEDHDKAAWWWRRIPRVGPAREDLLRSAG
jgi:hypothetical protein